MNGFICTCPTCNAQTYYKAWQEESSDKHKQYYASTFMWHVKNMDAEHFSSFIRKIKDKEKQMEAKN